MALRTLMLRKDISDKQKALEALERKDEELRNHEAELETAISEVETEEQRDAVNSEISAHEAEVARLEEEKKNLRDQIAQLESELANIEEPAAETAAPVFERNDNNMTDIEIRSSERAAFTDYVRKGKIENRDNDYNMTQGNNGAVVPKTIATEIITKVKEIAPIYAMSHNYPVAGTLEIPYYPYSSSHVIAAAYANEMAALTASSGDFGAVELTGFEAGALAKISKKLINNTNVDVVPFIVDQMAEAFKAFFEHECIVGTANKSTGLLAGIEAGATVTGTYKSSVTVDDLIACQCKVPTAYQANCRWLMAPATFEQIRKIKVDGKYALCPDVREGFGWTLLGKPVDLSENMPALGTADNKAVVYGDYSGLATKNAEQLEISVLNERFADVHAVGVIGWTEIDTKVENGQKFACIKCGSSDPQ